MSIHSLLNVESLAAPMLRRRDRTITAGEFIGASGGLSKNWPRARHVINLCERRFHFLLTFVSAVTHHQLTLLPPNPSAGALQELQSRYPECVVIDDADIERRLRNASVVATSLPDWRVDPDGVVAIAFTSGSTGVPQAHPKTWRTLARNAELAVAEVLGGAGTQLVATVPAQHVYGLETSAISALAARCCLFDERPFFAGDVRSALETMDEPRTLVTTPTHLRNLIESQTTMPSLVHVVSATAPLPLQLAERVEHAWRTQVFEIYGCTEAGIMAKRRTTEQRPWRTFSDGSITSRDDVAQYSAPQLPNAIPLQDIVESLSATEFNMVGRSADMIKVAGKRTSLQALTQQLLSVAGVTDAVVFVPHADARPAALVVAPSQTVHTILSELRERIDPVFLPRPLIVLEQLPRNSVGKLPQDALLKILRDHSAAPL